MDTIQLTKKNPNDPDADQLNPEIIKLARTHGFLNGPITLYLHGQLTWTETLETIILLLTKEYREQNKLLLEVIKEKASIQIALPPPSLFELENKPSQDAGHPASHHA